MITARLLRYLLRKHSISPIEYIFNLKNEETTTQLSIFVYPFHKLKTNVVIFMEERKAK